MMLSTDAAYKKNAAAWHTPYRQLAQLHHIHGKIGILRACWLLWEALTPLQHENGKLKRELREKTRTLKLRVLANYVKGEGCRTCIAAGCGPCSVPKLDNTIAPGIMQEVGCWPRAVAGIKQNENN